MADAALDPFGLPWPKEQAGVATEGLAAKNVAGHRRSRNVDHVVHAARWAAIQILQDRRAVYRPGSDTERIADHAVDLALSDRRPAADTGQLCRDAWRNSAHSYYRARTREQQALARWAATLTIVDDEDGSDIVDQASPQDILSDIGPFCDLALTQAATLGPAGPALVRRLMAGDTIAEAAAAAGISRASGYRLIRSLRGLLTAARPLARSA